MLICDDVEVEFLTRTTYKTMIPVSSFVIQTVIIGFIEDNRDITRKAYEIRGLNYEDEDEAFAPLAEAVGE